MSSNKLQPISWPKGRTMGCILWGLDRKLTALLRHRNALMIWMPPVIQLTCHCFVSFAYRGQHINNSVEPDYKKSIGFDTLRPRQNGRHFPDDIIKRNFLNENIWILINISLKFVPKGSINNIRALCQIMAWRRSGDKPLSEPMMVNSPTHICVTRPQWVYFL